MNTIILFFIAFVPQKSCVDKYFAEKSSMSYELTLMPAIRFDVVTSTADLILVDPCYDVFVTSQTMRRL